ncbi:helix-turn-helix transcriptional regulator [Xanthomonas campestris pv. campestris]|nr:helix-turn-helix transcriptional regulator [Xanthomonas campestris]MEB1196468.1 helix-turn-helix transcriptional regulator [Xanthomonas campestris pv. campestris]MEB1267673.1 helix-turn-helix transcriptional regulator [Xanthomonas campestris pv. campestris]MEB1279693.1 helix-turn-helix transcriptional regulator [Xanthomonas campestris pv. campestris]MEB1342252.1 helix-turn-helix transcriptional regulator [Xanthomonas campestris pv. campestris]
MHIMQIMHVVKHPSTANLVGKARQKLGLKQKNFAVMLGKSQGVVSRYEKGEVEPPGEVIMHCMHILGASEDVSDRPQTLENLVQTLERALFLLRTMRDASSDLIQSDDIRDNTHQPRQA